MLFAKLRNFLGLFCNCEEGVLTADSRMNRIESVRPNMHPIVQNCIHWVCHQQIFWSPFCFLANCFISVNAIRKLRAMQNNDSIYWIVFYLQKKNFHTALNGNRNFLAFFSIYGYHGILNNFYFYFKMHYTYLIKVSKYFTKKMTPAAKHIHKVLLKPVRPSEP